MSITIEIFQSTQQLREAHPEIKTFTVIHEAQPNDTLEETITALHKKRVDGLVFRVNTTYWKKAYYLPKDTICM